MTILFLTPTYKPAYIYGGVTVVTSLLAESLAKDGHDVTVYTTDGNGTTELNVNTGVEIIVDGVRVFYFKRFSRGHSHISPAFWRKINNNVKGFDIVHLHSWWNPTIVIAAAICKLRGVKPVLSPHGMLCDYILNTNNKKMKLLLHAVCGKSLMKNTYLHVSSEMEWNESQKFLGGNWSGVVIQNLVEPVYQEPLSSRNNSEPFVVGFLSRIDPKKRVDLLIKALSKVSFDYRFKIAGEGDKRYINHLKDIALKCGNSSKIDWVGWKDKDQKYEFYSSIDLLSLLSFNENFGVVVIEALSVGVPVFLSHEVGLSKYVETKSLGWVANDPAVPELVKDLEKIFMERNKRLKIQETAPAIIRRDFNRKSLTDQYLAFYRRLNQSRSLKVVYNSLN